MRSALLRTLISIGVLAASLSGCQAPEKVKVSHDGDSGITTYETNPLQVSRGGNSTALGGADAKSISLKAVATCRGKGCLPDTIQLVFLASGSSPLSLSSVGGEITTDRMSITWTSSEAGLDPVSPGQGKMYSVRGPFAAIDVDPIRLRQVAKASSVGGSIGGIDIKIGPQVQSLLEDFLARVRSAGEASD